jgi:hypothetical protein
MKKVFAFVTVALVALQSVAQSKRSEDVVIGQNTIVTVEQPKPAEKSGWSEFHLGVSFPGGDLGDEDEAGIVLNKKFHIGIRYNNLESNKFKGKYTVTMEGDSDSEKFKTDAIDMSQTVLMLGVTF